MKPRKSTLALTTRLQAEDVSALREGFDAVRSLKADPRAPMIRNYADFVRAAIHRASVEAKEALQEERRAA